jgi:hypothetical protein
MKRMYGYTYKRYCSHVFSDDLLGETITESNGEAMIMEKHMAKGGMVGVLAAMWLAWVLGLDSPS